MCLKDKDDSAPVSGVISENQVAECLMLHRRVLGLASAAGATALACGYADAQRRPLQEGCKAHSLSAAVSNLNTSGVSVLDGFVDGHLITAVKGMEAFQSMPTRVVRARERAPKDWRQSAFGRFHRREEALPENDVKVIEQVEKAIWPLVVAFFQNGNKDDGTEEDICRSELQLMTAVPRSASQKWHPDNRSRGLTVIVPLVDFNAENGATQVLMFSHIKAWSTVAQHGAQVVQAPVGSIVAFDSRTYHRGLGNAANEGRPALILCYDRPSTPPPGCTGMELRGHAGLAALLNLVSSVYVGLESALRG